MRIRLLIVAALVAAALPAAALATRSATTELYASLNGKSEVPKGDPKATGTAEIKLTASTGKVCWEFKLKGVATPSAAHIHKGKPGTAGAVVVPFGTAFKRQGCTTAPKATIRAILANPGGYYVNVHNAKYPAGAVRGQLSRKSAADSGGYTY
jgi:hypothetical protein